MTFGNLDDLVTLEGKVAVVTGSSGGIGSVVTRLFYSLGATVLEVDIETPAIERPDYFRVDLCDANAIDAFAESISNQFDRVDILVHCAGIHRDSVLWKMDPRDWTVVLKVNLESAFHLLRGLTPLLRAGDESTVVLVSSINGERGKFGQSNYAASKAGLNALAKTAARELGRFGIRVNAIAPGMIETSMTQDLPQEILDQAREETALGRLGKPEDVASAALYLCSALSRHVTGQVLRVDGGQLTV